MSADKLAFRCPSCGGINRVSSERVDDAPRCGRCKTELDLAAVPADVDDATLAKVVRSAPVPVLVDFWAPWCGPCRQVAPHIKALAEAYAGKLIVLKVNTDQHQKTAQELRVRGIPTLAIWKGGELQRSQAGAIMGPALENFVRPYLG